VQGTRRNRIVDARTWAEFCTNVVCHRLRAAPSVTCKAPPLESSSPTARLPLNRHRSIRTLPAPVRKIAPPPARSGPLVTVTTLSINVQDESTPLPPLEKLSDPPRALLDVSIRPPENVTLVAHSQPLPETLKWLLRDGAMRVTPEARLEASNVRLRLLIA
jgi:hypothetical protein